MRYTGYIALCAALAALGCGDDTSGGNPDLAVPPDLAPVVDNDLSMHPPPPPPDMTTPPPPPPDMAMAAHAQVRLVNSAPILGAVDVYVQGNATPLAANVPYPGTSAWVDVPAGALTLELRAAGDAATVMPKLTTAAATLAAGSRTSFVAAGLPGSANADITLRTLALTDGYTAPGAGKARLRFVDAAYAFPLANMIGFDFGDDGSNEAALTRFTAADAAGLEVPAGAPLRVAIHNNTARSTSFTLPAALVGDGATALVVLEGNNLLPHDPASFTLLVVDAKGVATPVKQDPELYLLHAASDVGAVDVFLGGGPGAPRVMVNRSFPTFGGGATAGLPLLQQSPSATGYTLAFYPAGASDSAPASGQLGAFATGGLDAGERYLAVLSGLSTKPPAGQELALRVYRDDFVPPQPDKFGRIRIVDAVAGLAGAIDVGRSDVDGSYLDVTDNGTMPFAGLAFGAASPGAGTAIVDATGAAVGLSPIVRATGTTTPSFAFTFATQQSNDRVFGVPAGVFPPAPTGQQELRFLVINAPRESVAAIAVKSVLTPPAPPPPPGPRRPPPKSAARR